MLLERSRSTRRHANLPNGQLAKSHLADQSSHTVVRSATAFKLRQQHLVFDAHDLETHSNVRLSSECGVRVGMLTMNSLKPTQPVDGPDCGSR